MEEFFFLKTKRSTAPSQKRGKANPIKTGQSMDTSFLQLSFSLAKGFVLPWPNELVTPK